MREEAPKKSLSSSTDSSISTTPTTDALSTFATVPASLVRKERKIRAEDSPFEPTKKDKLNQKSQEWELANIRAEIVEADKLEEKLPISQATSAATTLPQPKPKEKKKFNPAPGSLINFSDAMIYKSTININLSTPIISSVQPQTPDCTTGIQSPRLRTTLQAWYRQSNYLKLPLSEQQFPIKDVSLTISDKSEQDLREKKRLLSGQGKAKHKIKDDDPEIQETYEFWSSRFRLEEEWHRIDKPIHIKDLFHVGSVALAHRILVEGRAGVGKSTFSQYIAWQWAEHNLFATQFDYVFWIPLRDCLADIKGNRKTHLINFIINNLPRQQYYETQKLDVQSVLKPGYDNRTLLILDGFDEVAHHLSDNRQPLGRILKDLMEFPNIIVTTRDYQIPPPEFKFDRRLVNIGFTNIQISTYIQCYYDFFIRNTESEEVEEILPDDISPQDEREF